MFFGFFKIYTHNIIWVCFFFSHAVFLILYGILSINFNMG